MRLKTNLLITLLIVLHLPLLVGGFFAPYDPTAQNRELPYAPPTRLHFKDGSGFHLRPFVYAWIPTNEGGGSRYWEDRSRAYPIQAFVRGDSYSFLGLFETNLHLFGVESPGQYLLFGTDAFGRDELSRVLYGGRGSGAAGIVATAATLFLGSIVAIVAGYYGGGVGGSLVGGSGVVFFF